MAAADRVVAIHQPNFFPWLGFFHKFAHADVFVLLDDVQFSKTGGTWTNRVKAMIGDTPGWLTVPVRRDYHGVKRINEISIDQSKPWRDRMCKTLEANYRRCAHFSRTMELVSAAFVYDGASLAEFNERGIRATLNHLGCKSATIVRSSDLGRAEQGTELLIAISKAVGAGTYLCGGGAGGYQDDAAFVSQGVRLVHQDFRHPVYPQTRRAMFHEGLSVLDALFEIGPEATAALLESRAS